MYKNLQANLTRFNDGDSAYFYDVVSPLFEKQYAEESAADFVAFQAKNGDEVKLVKCEKCGDGDENCKECEQEGAFITVKSLEEGFKEFKWKT